MEIVPDSFIVDNAAVFVELFSGMSGQFTSKCWSQYNYAKYGVEIKPALMKYIEKKYPDGRAIELTMVAIVQRSQTSDLRRRIVVIILSAYVRSDYYLLVTFVSPSKWSIYSTQDLLRI